ncbi:SurA N-terminal domain-containing protein [Amphibacillus jilinensis]|uniref:SurA N-terminal domain-containing protein n=1 Tax=Amphibacillus jilinensis TaxID=1216008 RepID=UPI00031C98BD|nr:SurA N-terminal domain-containing protein [Amphibacillus jilinensis]
MKKWILGSFLILIVGFLVACGNDEDDTTEQDQVTDDPNEELQMPEPDLEGIPDVVAEVNGNEITGAEFEMTYISQFQQAAMQAQMTGQPVDQDQLKSEIADNMIDQELLVQEADARGFEATEQEVDEMINEIAEANQLESRDELFSVLEEQGTSESEFIAQIEMQIKLEQLIADEVGEVEATEEELQTFYDDLSAQYEETEGMEELPPFEEVRPEIEEEIQRQEESEVILALVEVLRSDAEIETYI